ncbi:glycine--tRNA ligase subunit beta, partial [Vibrio cholerae O1 biovar El Tor]|nr:glycine--tRNA ligase subunit beta [Vibrio cholerae O1 biovar El Tor]
MTNGEVDEDLVRAGNESVLRARYEDAAFFFDSDLKVPLADLRSGISKLTFEDRIGSMADRADRIRDVATALAADVDLDADERS